MEFVNGNRAKKSLLTSLIFLKSLTSISADAYMLCTHSLLLLSRLNITSTLAFCRITRLVSVNFCAMYTELIFLCLPWENTIDGKDWSFSNMKSSNITRLNGGMSSNISWLSCNSSGVIKYSYLFHFGKGFRSKSYIFWSGVLVMTYSLVHLMYFNVKLTTRFVLPQPDWPTINILCRPVAWDDETGVL